MASYSFLFRSLRPPHLIRSRSATVSCRRPSTVNSRQGRRCRTSTFGVRPSTALVFGKIQTLYVWAVSPADISRQCTQSPLAAPVSTTTSQISPTLSHVVSDSDVSGCEASSFSSHGLHAVIPASFRNALNLFARSAGVSEVFSTFLSRGLLRRSSAVEVMQCIRSDSPTTQVDSAFSTSSRSTHLTAGVRNIGLTFRGPPTKSLPTTSRTCAGCI